MAKKRNFNRKYSKKEDYLVRVVGTISNIIELNKEYENHFKCVFSINIPRVEDKRFETCISWERQVINKGDLITIKGRFLENAFLVKSLRIIRKAQEELLLSNSPKGQEFETSPNKCTSSVKLTASPTTAQEEINGQISDTT